MKLNFPDFTVIHGGTAASSDTHALPPQARGPQGQALSPTTATEGAPWSGSTGSLEGLMPLFRSSDSMPLLGETGVITVGVNDLGWVVYDWAPGP